MRTKKSMTSAFEVADGLHSAAIHLLRRLRTEDTATGLTAPRLSALSVLVFAGPRTMSELATSEQVKAPTMTRLVQGLQRQGLVVRARDPGDARRVIIRATPDGLRLLKAGRRRRVAALTKKISMLPPADRRILAEASQLMESLSR
jgi:DNA-binding MarR family transcriptional regulator